jgi:nucleoside-diphosphate-sugar epimerase
LSSVLVTGATGFLGARLATRLLSEGEHVRVLVRSSGKARPLAQRGAQVLVGEITDRAAVDAAVDGVAVVYHLAGRLLAPGIAASEYRRTHVKGTYVVLSSCRQAACVERFVHCSTTGVLGTTGERPAGEEAPIRPTNVYEATKAEAELAVRQACREGFPAVIARPGLVYGPGDLHLLAFFRAVLGRRFRPIGRRAVMLHPIYIEDLTDALVRCGRYSSAVGECLHLAGPHPVALAEMAQAIARAGGTSVPAGHIPLPLARVVAEVAERLPPKLKRSAPLTRSRLEFLTHNRMYEVSKARSLLEFTASTDLHTGIERTLSWYREHGHLPAPGNSQPITASATTTAN